MLWISYHLMRHYFFNGARANVYRNMALENEGLSTRGWRQNSLLSVKDGEVARNPEFYLLLHFAHYVKKGAVMLATQGEMSSNTAVFRNPDGSRAAVILNPYPFSKTVTLEGKHLCLKARSFNTVLL